MVVVVVADERARQRCEVFPARVSAWQVATLQPLRPLSSLSSGGQVRRRRMERARKKLEKRPQMKGYACCRRRHLVWLLSLGPVPQPQPQQPARKSRVTLLEKGAVKAAASSRLRVAAD